MNPFNRRIVASTVLWVAVIVVAVIGMTSGDLTAGEKIDAPATSEDFAYFPGQYVNKATGASEHVQGF